MASVNVTALPTVPDGHVRLVLFERQPDPFYLEIPLRIIREVCCRPPKYLRYLGWCLLGGEGLLEDQQGNQVDLTGELVDQGIYHYRMPVRDVLAHAVDLEVIKLRSQVKTETETRENFRSELAVRDGKQCVWSGFPPGVGMHIIPWSKGNEWFRGIVSNRPHGGEPRLHTLENINDIRNGIMSTASLRPYFDSRTVIVLKTPNPILQMDDVPPRHLRRLLRGASYPSQARYTLQWLCDPELAEPLPKVFPNNCDAAFVSQHKPRPSDLLLHYNYGAAAVKNWGRNHAVLGSRSGLPRPSPNIVVTGPTTAIGDRAKTVTELTAARAEGDNVGGGSAAATDSEPPVWDEDDVMLFFWGNSVAARNRHAKTEQERNESINKWRAGAAV